MLFLDGVLVFRWEKQLTRAWAGAMTLGLAQMLPLPRGREGGQGGQARGRDQLSPDPTNTGHGLLFLDPGAELWQLHPESELLLFLPC